MSQDPVQIAAFYRYVVVSDPAALRETVAAFCRRARVLGTVHVASEGINGTVAGAGPGVDGLFEHLRSLPELEGLSPHRSWAATNPFDRLKVRLRPELVTSGLPKPDPGDACHVDAQRWNQLLDDADVAVVDVRNAYEHRLGSFPGAIDTDTQSFRDFRRWARDWVRQTSPARVAMFCTGGVRCEKASAALTSLGVEQVYQLQGGVLDYLSQVDADHNRWVGECFVFDNRVSVDRNLRPGRHEVCPHCRMPVPAHERELPGYERGVSCAHCVEGQTSDRRKALRQRAAASAAP